LGLGTKTDPPMLSKSDPGIRHSDLIAERFGFRIMAHAIGNANRSVRAERPFSFIENNFLAGRTSPVGTTGVTGPRSSRHQTPRHKGLRKSAVVPFSSALAGDFHSALDNGQLLSFNLEG